MFINIHILNDVYGQCATLRGWPKWWRPWSWRFAPFKVQGSTPLGCNQFLGATPPGEKPAIYPDPCRETSEGAVHGSREISRGTRKLARTPKDIKKKKKKLYNGYILSLFFHEVRKLWQMKNESFKKLLPYNLIFFLHVTHIIRV